MSIAARLEDSPQLLDSSALQRATVRMAHEIAERHPGLAGVVLVGVRTRGVPLVRRLAQALVGIGEAAPAIAALDPSGYRDDRPRAQNGHGDALSGLDGSEVPAIDAATVVVVDDVLFTGRTVRASLDALVDCGRPATVEVLAMVDRGHRELPLRATYVGKNVPTAATDRVYVRFREIDGVDGAWLLRGA
jgi:pyrimidine operon attenuation protein/uracil phosphoribosyltransferase